VTFGKDAARSGAAALSQISEETEQRLLIAIAVALGVGILIGMATAVARIDAAVRPCLVRPMPGETKSHDVASMSVRSERWRIRASDRSQLPWQKPQLKTIRKTALAVGLRVIDVPAPVLATVNSANETVFDILDAIPEGSSVSFKPHRNAHRHPTRASRRICRGPVAPSCRYSLVGLHVAERASREVWVESAINPVDEAHSNPKSRSAEDIAAFRTACNS
jgi:hypothetical protein